MPHPLTPLWLSAIRETLAGYRRLIDGVVEQLSDDELFKKPADGINSVAILLRHLGGNLRSRWTDFLTTDGEKPDRNRDAEFMEWDGDRQSLTAYFDQGWRLLESALETIDEKNAGETIYIRGEPHTVAQALARSVTHVAYHTGQIAMIARMVHQGEWKWLTIAPGGSATFNTTTWGTAAARGIANEDKNAQ